jgi:hypothetical protein
VVLLSQEAKQDLKGLDGQLRETHVVFVAAQTPLAQKKKGMSVQSPKLSFFFVHAQKKFFIRD